MDEKQKFDLMMKNQKEEEKAYYFLDDPDEERITFNNYRRGVEGDFEMFAEQEENWSDCDKDCKSQILADLPTNDSNSYIFEHEAEEWEATKYLTRLGLLEKVEENDIFAIDDPESSLRIRHHDDFDLFSERSRILRSQNDLQTEKEIFFEQFSDNDVLDHKEKELLEEGLPLLQLDDEVETFHDHNSNRDIERSEEEVCGEIDRDHPFSVENEELINTTSTKNQIKKKLTEFNHLLERKTFRMMRKYYKNTFHDSVDAKIFKKKVKTMTPEEMDNLVLNYMKTEFGFLVGLLAGNELIQMITWLKRIILSDRFNKCERVTYGMDFASTRSLFNKYSTRALNEFICIPCNSILLVHFYLKHGKNESYVQRDVDKQKLERQMQCLVKVAFNYLPPTFCEIYSHANWQIINFLN